MSPKSLYPRKGYKKQGGDWKGERMCLGNRCHQRHSSPEKGHEERGGFLEKRKCVAVGWVSLNLLSLGKGV